jgi:GNAT superfamily N-acetyltransferase
MTDVAIRTAVEADLPALRGVHRRASLSNEGDREALLAHPEVMELDGDSVRAGRTRVAVAGDEVIGFASVIEVDDRVELDDMFVEPEWMGHGVGRRLVEDAFATLRAQGRSRLDVVANRHALAFYEKVGFVVDGEAETRFGSALHMHADL